MGTESTSKRGKVCADRKAVTLKKKLLKTIETQNFRKVISTTFDF